MPKDGEPIPEFPLITTLTQLVSLDALDAMTACELGAHVRLLERAWRSRPSGLPDDDGLLCRWSRLPATAWPQARPLALAGFTRAADGRLRHGPIESMRASLEDLAAKRSRAGKASALARSGVPPSPATHVEHVLNMCSASAEPVAPPHPPSASIPDSEALALQRSLGARAKPSAADEAPVDLHLVGAGARALIRDIRSKDWMQQMLTRSAFAWANPGRQTFPHSLIRDVRDHKHAVPMLIAYALEQIDAMGKKAVAGRVERDDRKFPDPLKLLIAAVGAQRKHPKEPWQVPLWFSTSWTKREEEQSRLAKAQIQIEQLRARTGWKNEKFVDENEAT